MALPAATCSQNLPSHMPTPQGHKNPSNSLLKEWAKQHQGIWLPLSGLPATPGPQLLPCATALHFTKPPTLAAAPQEGSTKIPTGLRSSQLLRRPKALYKPAWIVLPLLTSVLSFDLG